MVDSITAEHRSWVMSRIGSKNTKPELVVRSILHRLGYRFSLRRKLPGRPDIVMPKYNLVIFVHGCFWHQHKRCPAGRIPKSNVAFWEEKFAKNKARDAKVKRQLKKDGWRVHVVWECDLKRPDRLLDGLQKAIHEKNGPLVYCSKADQFEPNELLKVAEKSAASTWRKNADSS